MKEAKETKTDIKIGVVELPKHDYTQYIGKKVLIASVDTYKGQYGYYLKLTSSIVDIVKFGEEEKEITASRIFSLFEDKDGRIGWGNETQLGLFLTSKGVKHPDELLGRECVVQIKDKDGAKFLTLV